MDERKLIYANELDAAMESAQKTLETNWGKQWKMNKGQVKGLAWARAILREAKSVDVDAMIPRWISVEERLPEAGKAVLILARWGNAGMIIPGWVGHFKTREGETGWVSPHDSLDGKTITHWMPMPEPPEVNKP